MAGPDVTVRFLSDTSGLNKGFNEAGAAATKTGSSFAAMGKAAGVAAGVAGVAALTAAVKIGVGEWSESQKVTAQTEAVIKSTGGAAKVTTGHVTDLAEALMKKSGVDDEVIQSGENMLLTFRNVHNEVGVGNDIFDQATKVLLDMSTATGQDMTKSAIQLGKALNDPIAGMGALKRVGVTFTEAQKEQITTMVEAGNTMGAQKVILAELNAEFGGSAEAIGKTLPGQISILKESFNNFAGDLVGKVIPYIEQAVNYLRDNWPAINEVIQKSFDAIKPSLVELGNTIKALAEIVVEVVKIIKDNWGTIGPIVMAQVAFVQAQLKLLADVLRLLAALLRGDWSAAWRAAKQVVEDMASLILAAVNRFLVPIKTLLTVLWQGIKEAATTIWNAIKTLLATIHEAIKTNITNSWNAIKTAITTAMNAIKTAITTAWNSIKEAITSALNAIKSAITSAFNTIKSTVTSAVNATKAAVTTAWNAIKGVITGVVGPITGAVASVASAFKKPAEAATTMLAGIKSAFGGIAGAISGVVGAVSSAAQAVANAIMAPINKAKDIVNGILSRFNAIHFTIPTINIPSVTIAGHTIGGGSIGGQSWGVPQIPLLAKGGVVDRPTLALVGEGGREIVTPEGLLRSILAEQRPEVRVFIGDTELRGLVRTEIVDVNTGIARTLLAGTT